jgi:hypothetical protein
MSLQVIDSSWNRQDEGDNGKSSSRGNILRLFSFAVKKVVSQCPMRIMPEMAPLKKAISQQV